MEKVFVTGANGMLGSSICRELIKQGYEVKAYCFPDSNVDTIKELPITIVFGDVLNKITLLREMTGCSYVINAAALTTVYPRRDEMVKNVNIEGTKKVKEIAEELNIKWMVHIGSASSFNHGSLDFPGDETKKYNGWKLKMDYLDSKYVAQKFLLEQYKKKGFPVVIINPTFMIGAYDSGPSSGQMLISFCKGKLPGFAKGGKNFVCTTDVACAVVNALTMGKTGECYIAGNENLKYKTFFSKISGVLNQPFRMKKIPFVFILFVGAISSTTSRILKKKPVLSFGMSKFSGINQFYSSEKAVRELKMPQTPIVQGIKVSIDWFTKNGYL